MKTFKTKKTYLSILTVVLFTSLLLAGCGKTDNQTTDKQKDDKKVTTESKTNDKKDATDKPEEQKKDVMKTTDTPENPAAAIAKVKLPTVQCDQCKENITKALKKVDGVGDFMIDVDQKTAKIKFDMSKTDISKIENAITAAGYDANDKKADPESYKKLDDCCKLPADRKKK